MNAIDLRNAFENVNVDNFTVLLLRLISKSDRNNLEKLKLSFPIEVRAVEIYKSSDCPYVNGSGDVDYDRLSNLAHGVANQEAKAADHEGHEYSSRWFWKTNYCINMGLSPVQKEAWDFAEKAWEDHCKQESSGEIT